MDKVFSCRNFILPDTFQRFCFIEGGRLEFPGDKRPLTVKEKNISAAAQKLTAAQDESGDLAAQRIDVEKELAAAEQEFQWWGKPETKSKIAQLQKAKLNIQKQQDEKQAEIVALKQNLGKAERGETETAVLQTQDRADKEVATGKQVLQKVSSPLTAPTVAAAPTAASYAPLAQTKLKKKGATAGESGSRKAPEKVAERTDAQKDARKIARTKELIVQKPVDISWDKLLVLLKSKLPAGADKDKPTDSNLVTAIKTLQTEVGLSGGQVDGIFGKQTFAKLQGSSGGDVIVTSLRGNLTTEAVAAAPAAPPEADSIKREVPLLAKGYATMSDGKLVAVIETPGDKDRKDDYLVQIPNGRIFTAKQDQIKDFFILAQPQAAQFLAAWKAEREGDKLVALVAARKPSRVPTVDDAPPAGPATA